MPTEPLARYRRLDSGDLDEAREAMARLWERHRSEATDGRFHVRCHQADLARLSITYLAHPCRLRVRCERPRLDRFTLCFHHEGRVDHRVAGRAAVSMPGRTVLHAPDQALDLDAGASRVVRLGFDGDFVRQALSRRFDRVPPFEDWALEFPTDRGAMRALGSLCDWLIGELDRPGGAIAVSPRAKRQTERVLLALFLEALAERHPAAESRAAIGDEAPLRRAEAWIEANLAEPIGVEEIAAEAGVSVRGLRAAFQRRRGCRPLEFLRARRLERARRLLLAPTPEATVTSVALDCGFFHFGRFARHYRECFGERPSTTLARGRRERGLAA